MPEAWVDPPKGKIEASFVDETIWFALEIH
jgi:hypothetical protein